MAQDPEVMIYTLSTCGHCKKVKNFLKENNVEYDFVDVDLLSADERQTVLEDVKKLNPKCSFPTIKIGDEVIVGHHEDKLKEALGI
ncbi:MAG: glutaredoxin family protein [Desulfosalsimonadaceae bacterium]